MIKIPGYIIKREIGTGGMATVYLAVQASLERQVALKVMTPALAADRAFSKRFVREARTIAGLNHPNIVPIFEVGVTEDYHHFFSMQHLVGGDFTAKARGGIEEAELIRVLIGISRALGFAHRHGFVHRDVTPGNIMFDGSNTPILTDFGIARGLRQDTRITGTGVSIGTSQYMSPEQARSRDISPRSDLYSLGVVAFEALAGHPPYQGDDGFAVAYAHVYDPIPELPEARAHWQEFINRAMAKDPKDRFPDAEAVVASLLALSRNRVSESLSPELEGVAGLPDGRLTQHWRRFQQWLSPWLRRLRIQPITGQVGYWLRRTSSSVASGYEEIHDRVPRRIRPIIEMSAIGVCLALIVFLGYLLWPEDAPEGDRLAQVDGDQPVTVDAKGPSGGPDEANNNGNGTGSSAAGNGSGGDSIGTGGVRPGSTDSGSNGPGDGTSGFADGGAANGTSGNGASGAAGDTSSDSPADDAMESGDGRVNGDDMQAMAGEAAEAARRARALEALLNQADEDLAALRLMTPEDGNAFMRFTQVLEQDPGNQRAAAGLQTIVNRYISLSREAIDQGDFARAQTYLSRADQVARSNPIASAGLDVAQSLRDQVFGQQLQLGQEALMEWDHMRAQAAFEAALRFRPGDPQAEEGLAQARKMASAGYRFSDPMGGGGDGPQLVAVPPGEFILGAGGDGPTVAVDADRRFAISRHEITVDEFARFVEATNHYGDDDGTPCRDLDSRWRASRDMHWRKPGFPQAGNHPVVCVTFESAQAYASWLSTETGASYRLPSEAEWEYVATFDQVGDWPPPAERCALGNVGDIWLKTRHPERDIHDCEDNWTFTAPVGGFPANAAGVNDMTGNVREWVVDCWSETHEGHSGTTAPRLDGGCRERVVKDSAWLTGPDGSVPWYRFSARPGDAFNTIGFRVVRVME